MLTQINIKNFTIIDELDLSLNQGMTAVTGETGAGKSVMIDAIELALGKRASSDIIKFDKTRADISIEFTINENPTAISFLIENDLDDNENCLIRRTVHKDGRSKSYINGVPSTLQTLRTLGDLLINIHGQHEFQTLLKREQQLYLLDDFAHHDELINAIKLTYQHWAHAKAEFDDLNKKMADISDRHEFLVFQLKELNALNLQPNEIEEINREHQQLANADTLLSNCQTALNTLSEAEHTSSSQLLYQAHQAISQIEKYDDKLKNIAELINNAIIQTEEASTDLRHFLDRVDLNPERLQYIEERLAKIHELSKKHHVLPENLLSVQTQMQDECDKLENRDEYLETLKSDLAQKEKKYFEAAKKLSKSRQKAAKKLDTMITDNMQLLGMKGGKFSISFEPRNDNKPYPSGQEKISFLVSANPGQPLQALSKVASGGELSRISLAIQVITAKHSKTPTLIFDEVDAGIGGSIAEIVGSLLKELGQSTQTLCITHLPQVAAKAHHHLNVSKSHKDNATTTQITYLENEHRINEIARMSGGIKITEQTLAHAREMLK